MTPVLFGQMKDILSFLRRRGIVHFDCHDNNILTDRTKLFLTDFGLVSDKSFELSERERGMLRENQYYDCGVFLRNLIDHARGMISKLPKERKDNLKGEDGLGNDDLPKSARTAILLDNLGQICADGWLKLPTSYVGTVINTTTPFSSWTSSSNECGEATQRSTPTTAPDYVARCLVQGFLNLDLTQRAPAGRVCVTQT